MQPVKKERGGMGRNKDLGWLSFLRKGRGGEETKIYKAEGKGVIKK